MLAQHGERAGGDAGGSTNHSGLGKATAYTGTREARNRLNARSAAVRAPPPPQCDSDGWKDLHQLPPGREHQGRAPIYERLRREFGENSVFIDLEGIDPGEDFGRDVGAAALMAAMFSSLSSAGVGQRPLMKKDAGASTTRTTSSR